MTGVWLGASYALGRPVPVTEPFPHVCGTNVVGRVTGRRYRLWRRDCAACLTQEHDERQQQPDGPPPPVDPDILAEQRRRLGETD